MGGYLYGKPSEKGFIWSSYCLILVISILVIILGIKVVKAPTAIILLFGGIITVINFYYNLELNILIFKVT